MKSTPEVRPWTSKHLDPQYLRILLSLHLFASFRSLLMKLLGNIFSCILHQKYTIVLLLSTIGANNQVRGIVYFDTACECMIYKFTNIF